MKLLPTSMISPYSPSSSNNIISFPLPTELWVSTILSGILSTGFPLHIGIPFSVIHFLGDLSLTMLIYFQ